MNNLYLYFFLFCKKDSNDVHGYSTDVRTIYPDWRRRRLEDLERYPFSFVQDGRFKILKVVKVL